MGAEIIDDGQVSGDRAHGAPISRLTDEIVRQDKQLLDLQRIALRRQWQWRRLRMLLNWLVPARELLIGPPAQFIQNEEESPVSPGHRARTADHSAPLEALSGNIELGEAVIIDANAPAVSGHPTGTADNSAPLDVLFRKVELGEAIIVDGNAPDQRAEIEALSGSGFVKDLLSYNERSREVN